MVGAVVDVRRLQVGADTVSRFGVQSKLPTTTMVLSSLKTETILPAEKETYQMIDKWELSQFGRVRPLATTLRTCWILAKLDLGGSLDDSRRWFGRLVVVSEGGW